MSAVRRPWRARARGLGLGLLILLGLPPLAGCGGGVAPLSVQDPRLPAAARRRVADAEDAVVVARARVAEARAQAGQLRHWRRQVAAEVQLGAATAPLLALADGRLAHAAAQVSLAEAEVAHAQARRSLTYAETAVRHDLRLYALAPLQATVAERLQALQAGRRAVQDARAAAQAQAGAFWQAYHAYVRGGGDTRSFWLVGAAP